MRSLIQPVLRSALCQLHIEVPEKVRDDEAGGGDVEGWVEWGGHVDGRMPFLSFWGGLGGMVLGRWAMEMLGCACCAWGLGI